MRVESQAPLIPPIERKDKPSKIKLKKDPTFQEIMDIVELRQDNGKENSPKKR